MLHTVWPAVPVTAVVGAALRHLSSVPQYLRNIIVIIIIIIIPPVIGLHGRGHSSRHWRQETELSINWTVTGYGIVTWWVTLAVSNEDVVKSVNIKSTELTLHLRLSSPSTLGHDRVNPRGSTLSVHSVDAIGRVGNWHLEGSAPVAHSTVSSLRPRFMFS